MTAGCPGCTGTEPWTASPGCAEQALVVAEREFGNPAYFAVHAITAAAYRVQHPATVTPYSVAVGLVVLEGAGSGLRGAALEKRIRWAAPLLRARTPALDPPSGRWTLTIDDVAAASTAEEHGAVVLRWAEEIAEGWASARAAVTAVLTA
ncbi:hypothetical protein GCM10009836_47580 [Pseudonocardia ailaonensis]|uniref:Uncharacterized protein n=1 Tax=Pseudonocardia ailaonensis TaxID=367279 RepID=A0ABN2NBM3_9PSEU